MDRVKIKFYFDNEFEIWKEFDQSKQSRALWSFPPFHHHVFHLPSVCAKTLAKNKLNQRKEKMQKESS